MFRFTQEPSPGSCNQCLAKITSLVRLCMSVQTSSVLWRHAAITLETVGPSTSFVLSTKQYSIVFQKMVFIIIAAVLTSNLTFIIVYHV